MAVVALKDCDVFVDGVELSGFASTLTHAFDATTVERTTFASVGWKEEICAIRSAEFDVKGPQDFNTSTVAQTGFPDEFLFPAIGAVQVVSGVPLGGTEGNVALFGQGVQQHYGPIEGSVGQLAEYSAKWKSTDRMARGVLATLNTAVTATGNGTVATGLGAVASGQRLCAALHVLSASGTTPSITVTVQSAATNFASPTTRLTFNAATVRGGQFLTVAGPITDTFWRAIWTVTGTTPSFSIRVLLGII